MTATAVTLGVVVGLVPRPSEAKPVPAIELVPPTTSRPPTTTDSTREEAAAGKPDKEGSATSPRSSAREGASPAQALSPAPAGDDDDGDD